jgi:hypothetical protein
LLRGTKDAALQLAGVWIVELAELDAITRAEISRIKSFMSRRVDRFRTPYARRVEAFPRQCVFAGSVNETQYLRDPTGGRRFWPIACGKIHIDSLTKARDRRLTRSRRHQLLVIAPIGLLHLDFGCDQSEGEKPSKEAVLEQRRLGLVCTEQISLAIANVKHSHSPRRALLLHNSDRCCRYIEVSR